MFLFCAKFLPQTYTVLKASYLLPHSSALKIQKCFMDYQTSLVLPSTQGQQIMTELSFFSMNLRFNINSTAQKWSWDGFAAVILLQSDAVVKQRQFFFPFANV